MNLGKRLFQSTGINLIDHAVKLASVLAISPLMVRSLGKETYGLWLLLMSVFACFTLLDAGLTVSGSHFAARALGAKDESRWRVVMGTCHRIYRRAGWIAVGLSVLFSLSLPIFFSERNDLPLIAGIVLIYGIAVSIRLFCKTYAVALRAHLRYDLIVIPGIVRTLIQMGLLWLIVKFHGGLGALGLLYAVSELVEVLVVSHLGAKTLKLPWRTLNEASREGNLGSEMTRHAGASFMTVVGVNLRSRLDPIVVGAFSGLSFVTVYSVGTRFIGFFEDIINALLGGQFLAAFSQIEASGGSERLTKAFLDCTRLGVMAATLCGGGLMMIGSPFIQRWMGADFAESGVLLLILTPPYVLRLMQYSVANLLYSRGRPEVLALLTFAGGGFNLIVSLILVSLIGFHGVVWGTAVELTVISLIVLPMVVAKIGGIPAWTYLRGMLVQLLLASVPVALCWLALNRLLIPHYGCLLLAGGILVVVCCLWYWLVMLTGPERAAFRGMLKR